MTKSQKSAMPVRALAPWFGAGRMIAPLVGIVPYEVGRYYTVPTIDWSVGGIYRTWVVIGPRHTDEGCVGFENAHYHIDARFLPKGIASKWLKEFKVSLWYSVVIHDSLETGEATPPIVYRRRRCMRAYDDYPARRTPWMECLSREFENVTLKSATCPHRGASLEGLTPDADGCVTCPLHGLRWDTATGRLRPLQQK